MRAPFLPIKPPASGGNFTDRKSTRLNSSHANISYAVFCLKKKKKEPNAKHTPVLYHRVMICIQQSSLSLGTRWTQRVSLLLLDIFDPPTALAPSRDYTTHT